MHQNPYHVTCLPQQSCSCILEIFVTLLLTFASLVPILAGGVYTTLLLTLSFVVVSGVDDFNNFFCLHEMKLG